MIFCQRIRFLQLSWQWPFKRLHGTRRAGGHPREGERQHKRRPGQGGKAALMPIRSFTIPGVTLSSLNRFLGLALFLPQAGHGSEEQDGAKPCTHTHTLAVAGLLHSPCRNCRTGELHPICSCSSPQDFRGQQGTAFYLPNNPSPPPSFRRLGSSPNQEGASSWGGKLLSGRGEPWEQGGL